MYDEGATERHGYMTDNPRKAGLVDDPAHWPGLNLAYGFGDAGELTFEYLDRTAWHKAGRPKDLAPYFRTATLTLSPLPSCEGCSREVYRASLMSWIQAAHDKALAKDLDGRGGQPTGRPGRRPALGVDKVIATPFDTWPKQPARSHRPYVFGTPENRQAYTAAAMDLDQPHRECSERYRAGEHDVTFPSGMYPPPLLQAA